MEDDKNVNKKFAFDLELSKSNDNSSIKSKHNSLIQDGEISLKVDEKEITTSINQNNE